MGLFVLLNAEPVNLVYLIRGIDEHQSLSELCYYIIVMLSLKFVTWR